MPARNAVLITVDSLRADHLGSYAYSRGTSPHIDQLASEGALFRQAISPGGATPEAFPSILASGYPPLAHPYATPEVYRRIVEGRTSLASTLRTHGLRTAAFHSNPYLSAIYGYGAGFETFEDGLELGGRAGWAGASEWVRRKVARHLPLGPLDLLFYYLETHRTPYSRAERITAQATEWLLAHASEPFFLWVHYMDVHIPYVPPHAYLERFHPGASRLRFAQTRRRLRRAPRDASAVDLRTLVDAYDAAIAYTDHHIGVLIEALRITGHFEDTVVALTSDHGQEFGEHGHFFHGHVLYDPVVRVPLVLRGPGVAVGSEVAAQTPLWDLAPTIAELVGALPVVRFAGSSLASALNGAPLADHDAVSTTLWGDMSTRSIAYRSEGWKLLATLDGDGGGELRNHELYDLGHDPGEHENKWDDPAVQEVRQRLAQSLESALAVMRQERSDTSRDDTGRLRAAIRRARSTAR